MGQDAFVMRLKDGCAEEYRRRHDRIWPELLRKFSEYGIRDYSIFFDAETRLLFAVRRVSHDFCAKSIGEDEVFQEWWAFNANLMECNPDRSPQSRKLEMIFHVK